MSVRDREQKSVQAEITKRRDEKRLLKHEEKAILEMKKKIQAQLIQLEIEALEIKARTRGEQSEGGSSSKTERSSDVQAPPEENVNDEELDLGVNSNAILDRMMRSRQEEEEESDDEWYGDEH